MGSLTSRPKVKTVDVSSTPVVTPTTSTTTSTTTTEPDPVEIAKARAENVLRRSRSALGTVMTSFRGVLSRNNMGSQRKSLLGE